MKARLIFTSGHSSEHLFSFLFFINRETQMARMPEREGWGESEGIGQVRRCFCSEADVTRE